MRRNSFSTFLKEKSFIIVLTLMLVSAGTMAALFAFGGDDAAEENLVAEQEETRKAETVQAQKEPAEEQAAAPVKSAVVKRKIDTKDDGTEAAPQVAPESAAQTAELEDQFLEAEELAEEMAEVSATDVIAEGFSEKALLTLQWPLEGEILMPFSMDQSIYFTTLAQYQYNPAMMISAPEGTDVVTCAAGTVVDVGKSNTYGHYVTMDLGDGFMLTYGQLIDITTEVGETLDVGTRIAMVSYPTRSFLEEGDNLYLKLTQNGVPVDPELYLEQR